MKRVHLWISGRVQGVSFRYYTREKARELGVLGWVRNLSDGRVEVVAEGEPAVLDPFVEWCRHGPVCAVVEDFVLEPEDPTGEFTHFGVVR